MNVFITTFFSPWSDYSGGGQRSTHNLATALSDAGHAVTVVYSRCRGERVDVPGGIPYRIEWAEFPCLGSRRNSPARPLGVYAYRRVVQRLLETVGSGTRVVVHGQGEESCLVPALRNAYSFGFVLTSRYPSFPQRLTPSPSLWRRVELGLTNLKYLQLGSAIRQADLCCATSRSAANGIERAYGIPRRSIEIIPNGVSEVFLSANRVTVEDRSGVVYFGRLSYDKGVDTLIEALFLMGDRAPRCTIVGRGEKENDLRKMASDAGLADRITFSGWKEPSGLARLLERCELAVLPSREESFGNSIAEAMAVGCPVVSTQAGSIPEIITNGETGVLVPPGDAGALYRMMDRLLGQPDQAERMGRRARLSVASRFSWKSVAERYMQQYVKVLDRRE